jgi:hypothetical protein
MKKINEKVLIFYDSNKASDLDRNVEFTQQGANDLIHIFESFQSYKKIQTLMIPFRLMLPLRNPEAKKGIRL